VRIKALPLSQSKQKTRTEEVITIQRGKDSWNQRPQTSGSLTPPLTRDPPCTLASPPCALPPPHAPFAAHPSPPLPPATPPPLHRTCCLVAPAPSPPLRTRAPPCIPFAYKTPNNSLSSHPKQSTHQIKSPLPNCKQLHFFTPSPLRSQCLVILGLKTVAHGS
jgi:hypothetical protein